MDIKGLLSGMIGGFFTVAIVSLVLSKNSRTVEVIKESAKGFGNILAVAKSDSNTSTGM